MTKEKPQSTIMYNVTPLNSTYLQSFIWKLCKYGLEKISRRHNRNKSRLPSSFQNERTERIVHNFFAGVTRAFPNFPLDYAMLAPTIFFFRHEKQWKIWTNLFLKLGLQFCFHQFFYFRITSNKRNEILWYERSKLWMSVETN